MLIRISGEVGGMASSRWFELQKEFNEALEILNCSDYGEAINTIDIVSIILNPKFCNIDAHRESASYSSNKKEADIRKRIDYFDFIKADAARRKELYIDHICQCIEIANNKAGKKLDVERLVMDVRKILEETTIKSIYGIDRWE